MYFADFDSPSDLLQFAKILAGNLAELHFVDAANELTDWATCAWTTSSEFVGELGVRCRRIQKRDGKRLPPCLRDDLDRCIKAYRQSRR